MLRRWIAEASFIATATIATLAQATSSPAKLPAWDVVSVHPSDPARCTSARTMRYTPDGMHGSCVTLLFVIQQAYALLQQSLILNAPEWVKADRLWDIDAKVAGEDAAAYDALKPSDKYRMMQSALSDRFRMKAHMEHREIPVYDLVIGKGGPKLKEATAEDADKERVSMREPGDLEAIHAGMSYLPILLNTEVGRTIVDKTGLTGRYDFTLKYVPASKAASDDSGPSIFTGIQEQLGLKLQPARVPMDVLVIDEIEQPTVN